ncbi:MAG: type II toxin-antitoxin system RelE/ParE family toxin [Bacteroidales bacterium]|nr:type II toxin-antitoxin system RelE/ParE family toxin [Bacteroidales bacterium]
MAYRNHWLRRAEKDFNDIYLYYRRYASEEVAKRRLEKILQTAEKIEGMPNIGMLDDEFPHTPSYRHITVLDYRIYYFVEEDVVNIAAIWDCRQGGDVF